MTAPKISIICDDPQLRQTLVQNIHFMNMPLGEMIERTRDAYMHLDPKEPRIVLLAEPAEPVLITQTIQQLKRVNEAAPILYLSRTAEFASLREIYRAGVMDILRMPDELDQLQKAIAKAVQQLQVNRHRLEMQAANLSANAGKIIAIYSGQGGAGTTMVSANLANALALNTEAKTLLIDLNLQFGSIHHMFDIRFDRNLGDLKTVLQELTFSQLDNVVYKMDPSGLNVLLSPNHPQEAENFRSEDIELLLAACRQHYDAIVLDLPNELNEISISAISQCDLLLYILQLDRPSIVRMKQVLDILDRYHLIQEEDVCLVVNKYSKAQDVTRGDLEKMTALPIIGVISEDRKGNLQSCINLGRPLLSKPNDKGEKGPPRELHQLMTEVVARMGGEKRVHLSKAKQPAG
jgi:pilus assembly protein CpaE